MDNWHATFLGLRRLPRELTAFEMEVFSQFSVEEARIIEDRRSRSSGCRGAPRPPTCAARVATAWP